MLLRESVPLGSAGPGHAAVAVEVTGQATDVVTGQATAWPGTGDSAGTGACDATVGSLGLAGTGDAAESLGLAGTGDAAGAAGFACTGDTSGSRCRPRPCTGDTSGSRCRPCAGDTTGSRCRPGTGHTTGLVTPYARTYISCTLIFGGPYHCD